MSDSETARDLVADDDFVPPTRRLRWAPSVRIIPSRFPPIDLFERVADPADLESVLAVEALTNARLRDEVGDLPLVEAEDRVSGPGASFIMAPFTHVYGPGGRYSTKDFGAYYTARSLRTAVAETRYHRERFLRATNEAPIEIGMRVLYADLSATLHDVRGKQQQHAALYESERYDAPQRLAARLRANGSHGVVYDSVRDNGGQCAAVFRPRVLRKLPTGRTSGVSVGWRAHCKRPAEIAAWLIPLNVPS